MFEADSEADCYGESDARSHCATPAQPLSVFRVQDSKKYTGVSHCLLSCHMLRVERSAVYERGLKQRLEQSAENLRLGEKMRGMNEGRK